MKEKLEMKNATVTDEIEYADGRKEVVVSKANNPSLFDEDGNARIIVMKDESNVFLRALTGYIILIKEDQVCHIGIFTEQEMKLAFFDVIKIEKELGTFDREMKPTDINTSTLRFLNQLQLRSHFKTARKEDSETEYVGMRHIADTILSDESFTEVYNISRGMDIAKLWERTISYKEITKDEGRVVVAPLGIGYRLPAVCQFDIDNMWKEDDDNGYGGDTKGEEECQ